ncbi:hypothetical protein ACNQR7_32270 [Mycolicibacterium senegalense]|uniref:hypothetical protein n=1 Tax=Mycolicibacterium senegalense TaxID=1796 RepID=UPI003AAB91AE
MNTSGTTLTAQAPDYALDGSQGYLLAVSRGWRASGWIYVGDDGRTVRAAIDGAGWQQVGTVSTPSELTPDWVAEHAEAILRPF